MGEDTLYRHPRTWLFVRIVAESVLIGDVVYTFLGESRIPRWTGLPLEVGEAVLVLGVIIVAIHYGIHFRKAGSMGNPSVLVMEPGLFRVIRYPVHLGELVIALGLALLVTDAAGPILWLVILFALIRQCDDEDEEMLHKFGEGSVTWLTGTKRLFPLIW